MKTKLIFMTALLMGSMSVQAGSDKNTFDPQVYRALVSICTEARQDDISAFKKTLKEHRIGIHTALNNVVCNGKPLLSFAKAEQSDKVTKFLLKYQQARGSNTGMTAPN